MVSNVPIGIFLHWLGGLASASFYLPYRKVRGWNWETYWLVGGFFSWILAPWFFAEILTKDLFSVLEGTPLDVLFYTFLFGAMWGFGGLTFGLTMRYLGISLGMAVALSFCSVFGTLIPPLFHGTFWNDLLARTDGQVVLGGILVCVLGIALAGAAGMTKESELTTEQKRRTIKEFNFARGMGVATFSGIMSACFSFALDAAKPMKEITIAHGTDKLWAGLPALIVVMLGGFTTNFVWCLLLNANNRSFGQYFGRSMVAPPARGSGHGEDIELESAVEAPAEEMALRSPIKPGSGSLPLNYLFSGLAGTTWYFQFFFYQMGTSQMGRFDFASWTLHMASIMIFSTLWGLALQEWKGCSSKVFTWLFLALFALVGSTVIIGFGAYLKPADLH